MNITHILRLFPALCLATLMIAGCSGEGEQVVDPRSNERDQVVMIATEGAGGDEIFHFSEATGVVSQNAYADANGGPLGKSVDQVTEAYDRLYLHHRATGSFTVLDVKTRKHVGEITGFPASADSGICGLAFSNSTWGWVVCYNSPNVYLVDMKNLVIARAIPLPSNLTSVGTVGTKIFVGLQLPDGRGQVAVLSSNTGNEAVERTIDFPSPIIFAAPNSDKIEMILLSTGIGDNKPTMYVISLADYSTISEIPLNARALTAYIGQESTFATVSRNFYLYVATPDALLRADTQGSGQVDDWMVGDYRVVGVDPWSDLTYGVLQGSSTIQRVTSDGEDLEDIAAPAPVKAITFVSAYKTR